MTSDDEKKFPHLYHLIVEGHLLPSRQEHFRPMEVVSQPDGTTHLIGIIEDQAALYGLVIRLRDIGLSLISIQPLKNKQMEDDPYLHSTSISNEETL